MKHATGFAEFAQYLEEVAARIEKANAAIESVSGGKSPNAISDAGHRLGIDVGKKLRPGNLMFEEESDASKAARNPKILEAEQDAAALAKALEEYFVTGRK
jgi:hypothetical protein